MARGGQRSGAGRPKGAVAKHRKLANEATQQAIGTGMTPLAFLLSVMRDPDRADKDRLAAATAAAGYVHPKLSSVEHSGEMKMSHEQAIDELEDGLNGAEHEHAH